MEIVFYTPADVDLQDTFKLIQTFEYDVVDQENRLVIFAPEGTSEDYWVWLECEVFDEVYDEERKSELIEKHVRSAFLMKVYSSRITLPEAINLLKRLLNKLGGWVQGVRDELYTVEQIGKIITDYEEDCLKP